QVAIESWFRNQWHLTPPAFYGSVDLRNAGFKLAPVDTNLFPAGFNNLNIEMMALCVQAVQATMAEKCPCATRLLLIPESHTRNLFYFENLATLAEILERAGFDVRIASLIPDLTEPLKQLLPSGREITLEPLIRENDRVGVKDYFPCCIILNNDFSAGVPDILKNTEQLFMPALKLGWSTRLKSDHFRFYQSVCEEFSKAIDLDPWLINPYFDHCEDVDFSSQDGHECLAKRADILFDKIRAKYAEYKIDQAPFVVVKADQGTYGMAVMMIKDAKELLQLNRKQRNKMGSLKGGSAVTKVILQEGVYTFETVGDENSVAEPVVYHIGRHVVGGFYRVHKDRGVDENLNAPGMDFQPLAFAKNCHVPPCGKHNINKVEDVNRFYAYGVVGRLAMVAAARELV
ncbi:MAG: glutamate--cysteine ligase, partial [Gammaproteobacteria bacterium]|nr:glutamate--cysteine ligase [Gammaproteobacteria bacterium]